MSVIDAADFIFGLGEWALFVLLISCENCITVVKCDRVDRKELLGAFLFWSGVLTWMWSLETLVAFIWWLFWLIICPIKLRIVHWTVALEEGDNDCIPSLREVRLHHRLDFPVTGRVKS